MKLFFATAIALCSLNIPNSQAASPIANTACYYSFDIDRYVPFSEQNIHTSSCYAVTDDELQRINNFIQEAQPPSDSEKYNSQNLKVAIYSSTTQIFIDHQGIAKIDGTTYKNLGATQTKKVIRLIFDTKRKLPQKR